MGNILNRAHLPPGHSHWLFLYLYTHVHVQVGDLYQEAEPLVASGVAATLQLATQKGFVCMDQKKPPPNMVVTTTGRRDV